eukprot:TRINITY_DN11362_c0_g1_i1.p1 TRINITY_DN11362_c0_g1~~TRINITY_DN11362_c0_g1_i1.p1  ORF type:complete len:344 (-),score=97.67 TRINITY_DN11362_c0_g1_i1:24-1055(-)
MHADTSTALSAWEQVTKSWHSAQGSPGEARDPESNLRMQLRHVDEDLEEAEVAVRKAKRLETAIKDKNVEMMEAQRVLMESKNKSASRQLFKLQEEANEAFEASLTPELKDLREQVATAKALNHTLQGRIASCGSLDSQISDMQGRVDRSKLRLNVVMSEVAGVHRNLLDLRARPDGSDEDSRVERQAAEYQERAEVLEVQIKALDAQISQSAAAFSGVCARLAKTRKEAEVREKAARVARRELQMQQPEQPVSPISPKSSAAGFRRNLALNDWQNARVAAMRERLLKEVLGKQEKADLAVAELEGRKGRAVQAIRTCWCRICLLYTSPSPRDRTRSRMPSSA